MRRTLALMCLLAFLAALPAACGQGAPDVTEEPTEEGAPPGAVEPTQAPLVAETVADVFGFEPVAQGGDLVIGQGQEPGQLYLYGGSMLAASHVQNSLWDGPIEGLDYDFQPVILERLPKIEIEGSGAMLEMVAVEAGQRYVDPESQEVVTATEMVAGLPQLTVRYTLKEGVTWEDGTPVTAADSAFSRELACDPDTPVSKFVCERTAQYVEIDERTAEWKGLPGYTDQTYFNNFYTPQPRHQANLEGTRMDEMAAAEILTDETFTRHPLSYGPFKIVEWESGDHITLTRNEYYWRAGEGLPILDNVIHKFIPDSNSLLAALKSGDVDVATQDGLDISQVDAMTEAEELGQLVPYYVVGTVWEHIDFDVDPVDERDPLGACLDVRKAMTLGTDRQTMVEVIQKGLTRVQHTIVPQEHWAFPPDDLLVAYDYEPEAAKQLLEDLGFVDQDGDGYREAAEDITCPITIDIDGNTKDQVIPAGTPVKLTLNTTSGNAMRGDTTLLFQQNMADIGIDIVLEYMDANVYFEDGPDGLLFGRRFDLGEFAWLTGVQPSVALYFCTQIPAEVNGWAGQNETGWCDPEYDRAGKEAMNTLARGDALPLYHAAQKLFMENLPVMPLFARVKVMGINPAVVNFRPNPTVNSETWNIETWGFAEEGP